MAGASSARRIELNRAAFEAVDLAMVDAAFTLAERVIVEAGVPDAPPYGEGLVEGGGVIAYYASKKVGQMTTGATSAVKKPRGAKLNPVGWTVVGGYGFPARFYEEGTVNQPARPFLTPALLRIIPEAAQACREAAIAHQLSSKERGIKSAEITSRIKAAKAVRRERIAARSLKTALAAEAARQGY